MKLLPLIIALMVAICQVGNSTESPPTWQIVYFGAYQPNGADYTILDLFEHSAADVRRAKNPIAYFSAHYENWRPDAKDFGRKLRKIGGWNGEYYIDWTDLRNQSVMRKRLDLAAAKGFTGVDIDNVDGPGTAAYFGWLLENAKARGLKVGLKNAVEVLPQYGSRVDFFVSEASARSELDCYHKYQKPTVRMYYGKGAVTPPWMFSVRNKNSGNRF